MIANCGTLGLDWRQTDLSDYLEALEAYNEAHDPDRGKVKEASPQLQRFMAAHKAAGSNAAGKA